MKLSKIIVSNFKCFGPDPTEIDVNDLTCFIGHNSSGKTALLQGLQKLFGATHNDRLIQRSDFYVSSSKKPEEITENKFYIEAQFIFPELDSNEFNNSVPIFFKNMVVNEVNGTPYLRIRLDANWTNSSNPEGSIDYKINYITNGDNQIGEDNIFPAKRSELDNIRLIYVPAIRKPTNQLKNVSGTILSSLLKGINWTDNTKENVKEKMHETEEILFAVEGVNSVQESLKNQWSTYYNDNKYSHPKINFNSSDLESILKNIDVTFSPTELPREYSVNDLGDGLQSLFYLSLVNTLLDIEESIIIDNDEQSFSIARPGLTIVAVEEPENHLSPNILGRIVENLISISAKSNSQTIVTSHSPSIVKRIDPKSIRHFRVCSIKESTNVNALKLPDSENESEQYKYIKESILSYPEILFSKLIVLGEGESEEIIIRKMIEIQGNSVDSSEISIAPLGGRHVNHFWRLLNELSIPYITLLDLDRERNGGGWGRIKYVLKQLILNGVDKNKLLLLDNGEVLKDTDFEEMHTWDNEASLMNGWMDCLKEYDVFFSSPLDIDFCMLESFGAEYKQSLNANEGPFIKGEGKIINIETNANFPEGVSEAYKQRITESIRTTLKPEGGNGITYNSEQKQLMIWYNYFFLGRGKPSTHINFFSNQENIEYENFPDCLLEFSERINQKISGLKDV